MLLCSKDVIHSIAIRYNDDVTIHHVERVLSGGELIIVALHSSSNSGNVNLFS